MSVTLHTNLGDLKIEVYCDTVPRTAFNFLALCASGYYDHTQFHRNVRGFMVQGGDPTGTGKGGDSIWGGKFADEIHPENTHSQRGIISMANSVRRVRVVAGRARGFNRRPRAPVARRLTATCTCVAGAGHERLAVLHHLREASAPRQQLCALDSIPFAASSASRIAHLPGADAVFAKVIDGFETLDAMERVAVDPKHRPMSDMQIEKITIHANPLAEQMIVFPSATGPPDIQS